ncbi:MAG: RlmE family RNA methyltransferase [Acetobacteraceae bacterium]|nr:RlmE family RNA methyltransferase [Acetobacteraceae bacterium]
MAKKPPARPGKPASRKPAAGKKPRVAKPPGAAKAGVAKSGVTKSGPAKPAVKLVPGRTPAGKKKRSSATRGLAVVVRSGRGRTTASQEWLKRQLNDPYVAAAQAQGWRSRAAFKLIEMDDRYHLIRPGMRVLDLGAAPGGWSQVATKRGAGQVVALDLLPVDPIPGVTMLQGDFNDDDMPARLMALMGGPPDLVLSDMAPNTTGHNATDHLRIIALAELALEFAMKVLAPGGAFVAKVFQGGSEKAMLAPMKLAFATVRHAKPPASRKESSELYVIATGFRGRGAEGP